MARRRKFVPPIEAVDGGWRITLDAEERDLLIRLMGELEALLTGPQDNVLLLRLFGPGWALGLAMVTYGTSAALGLRIPRSRVAEERADSVVVAGLTTSGCVRATAVDALQHDYPVIVVREAVGDRDAARVDRLGAVAVQVGHAAPLRPPHHGAQGQHGLRHARPQGGRGGRRHHVLPGGIHEHELANHREAAVK